MTAPRLRQPRSMQELVLYQMWGINVDASGLISRICEREFGITRREWRLLAHLAPDEGVLSSELAARVGLDRARTSRAISSLSDKRLIARTPQPGDRRQVALHLTEAGRALYNALFPRTAEINAALLADFTDAEVAQLERLLIRMQAKAARMASAADTAQAFDAD